MTRFYSCISGMTDVSSITKPKTELIQDKTHFNKPATRGRKEMGMNIFLPKQAGVLAKLSAGHELLKSNLMIPRNYKIKTQFEVESCLSA